MRLTIPKKENIIVTSYENPALLYYKPLIGNIYIRRLKMVIDLLDKTKKGNVLEIGYGCGILLPELSRHFNKIHAIDTHLNAKGVKAMLQKEGVNSDLLTTNLFNLPYRDDVFDCVICLSVLEHVDNLNLAVREIKRVAKKRAQIIFGIPTDNWIMKCFFRLLGYCFEDLHISAAAKIKGAIEMQLKMEKMNRFPNLSIHKLSLYTVVSCRNDS